MSILNVRSSLGVSNLLYVMCTKNYFIFEVIFHCHLFADEASVCCTGHVSLYGRPGPKANKTSLHCQGMVAPRKLKGGSFPPHHFSIAQGGASLYLRIFFIQGSHCASRFFFSYITQQTIISFCMCCHFACSYCGKSTVLEIYAETIQRCKALPSIRDCQNGTLSHSFTGWSQFPF